MDKQIEEMAKILAVDCGECYTCDYYDKHDKGLPANCTCFLQARELYKEGYRKIPEGAVVLTDEDEIKQYKWSKMLDRMGFFKFADNLRKETAEKFAERLKALGDEGVICHLLFNEIDEICKEITEGKV